MSEPLDLRALFLDNPELRRNLQIELSPKRMFTAGLITALYALIVLPSLLSADRSYPQAGISQYLMVMLWSQKLTLSLGGAIYCWRAVRRERELNTFDFQRITRLSPLELALGKLFGAPALSYFVTLCLALPAILSAVTTGPAAVSLLWRSYVLLFTGALVLHTFALMISTVSDKGGAVGGVLILVLLQIFPLIGWLSIVQNTRMGPNTQIAFAGETRFYGIPFPPTMLWFTLELGFAAFLLSAVVRNIKLELGATQLFSLTQGIAFALYCNFVWIGFYPWRATTTDTALGLLVLWCVLIFYVIGVGVLATRDLVRREIREISPVSAAPTRLLMPILAILGAAFLTSLVVVVFGQPRSLEKVATSSANNSYFLLFYFIAWLARDLFYLQWMNVRPVRSPMRKAFLYLGVFYISTSIVFRTAMASDATDAAAFSAWLAPFAALRPWTNVHEGPATGAWIVALLVQAASAIGFAYLYRQQILALAPQPYAVPPAPPRFSSKPA